MQYVVEAGGIAPEASYTYMGQDGFCRDKNVSSNDLIKFKVGLQPRHLLCQPSAPLHHNWQ